jgi:hypothetical protein
MTMSRHTSRKSRWTHINAKEFRAAFGVVEYRAGAWEGRLVFMRWLHESEAWAPESVPAGRFKRPRNAMIAVEDKARETLRRLGDEVKVAFEDK